MLASFLLWKAFLPSAHRVTSPSPVALSGAPAGGFFSGSDDMLGMIDTADWAQQHMPVNELVSRLFSPPLPALVTEPGAAAHVLLRHLKRK